jgi:hypothetical protein
MPAIEACRLIQDALGAGRMEDGSLGVPEERRWRRVGGRFRSEIETRDHTI